MLLLFSDIDGTCAHYNIRKYVASVAEQPDEDGLWPCVQHEGATARLLQLPPTTTGAQAVISEGTLQRYAALRALGVKLVLISGARTSTLLQRLPFLPAADAYVSEGGGRIFYPSSALPTAAPLTEDLVWRKVHADVAGPPSQAGLPPEQRSGLLWKEYTRLKAAGHTVDAASYTTGFRVRGTPEALRELQRSLPEGLASSINLSALDVYPATSGKASAARHLMDRWSVSPDACALMCDDDNDLPLAAVVARAYVPGFTADTVEAAAQAQPHKWYIAKSRSVFGTEEILRRLLAEAAGSNVRPT